MSNSEYADKRTETPGVYRRKQRNGEVYFRVLTRPDGKTKVMHRFETYEDAVRFKAGTPSKKMTGLHAGLRNRLVAYLRRDPCAYCGGEADTLDHIVPRSAGGTNHWANLTSACGSCNTRKHDRSLLMFMAHKNGHWQWQGLVSPTH